MSNKNMKIVTMSESKDGKRKQVVFKDSSKRTSITRHLVRVANHWVGHNFECYGEMNHSIGDSENVRLKKNRDCKCGLATFN